MLTARRRLLVGLLVASTTLFVVGVSLERSSADTHTETATHAASSEGDDDRPAEHAQDATLLGVDAEAWPFVALAAATSLALAAGTWLRPRWGALLVLIAAAMLAFAALDVREVVHQLDENRTGLALLAALVAALHLNAAAIAAAPSTFAL
jgi:hypothetical protein